VTRRYDHPKRQVTGRQVARAGIVARLNDPTSAIIDVTFIKLHEELVQWPDEWDVPGPCGSEDNPHKWFVNKTDGRVRVEILPAVFQELGVCRSARRIVHTIAIGEEMCPCGMLRADHEMVSVAKFYLDGLSTRDVQ
jgi:hypothetical protein